MCESGHTHNVAITIHLHVDAIAIILQFELHVTKRLPSYKNSQILENNTEQKYYKDLEFTGTTF